MSGTASLALLKGTQQSKIEDELEGPAATPTDEDGDQEVVHVEKMSAKDLDSLVKEYTIEVPENWTKMKVQEKRDWLNAHFGDEEDAGEEGATAAAPEVEDTPQEAPEEAPEAPSKAVAKNTKPKSGQIQTPGDDLLADLVHEIENMGETEALNSVVALTEQTDMALFKLGGVLSLIQAKQWYEPYATFKEFVENKVGMHYRKAAYWCSIYNDLVEANIPWVKVAGVGWSKLKEIAPILTNDNVDDWVKAAKENKTLDLIEMVKSHKTKGSTAQLASPESVISTKTFKLHSDQKETIESALDKAKKDSGTNVDTVALEFICLDFLGGSSTAQKLKSMGLEAALEAIEKAFPNIGIEVTLPDEAA